jgi:hypothetical protein
MLDDAILGSQHDPRVAPRSGVALSQVARRHGIQSLLVAASLLLAACASPTVTPSPPRSISPVAPTASPATASPSPSPLTESPAPSLPTTGFAFAADDIVAYYESQGYQCSAARPSTEAVGFTVRTCETVDQAGRTRGIGVVTDPAGGLANGFASVQGTATETFLAPVDALDPLAGFLGAMLGPDQGATLLTWLAGHLGDAYAETTIGPITVATYTESADDHSKLYVELANRVYLDAPSGAAVVLNRVSPGRSPTKTLA